MKGDVILGAREPYLLFHYLVMNFKKVEINQALLKVHNDSTCQRKIKFFSFSCVYVTQGEKTQPRSCIHWARTKHKYLRKRRIKDSH